MSRITHIFQLLIVVVITMCNLRAATSNAGVDAITITIDKQGDVTIKALGASPSRVFRGAEFLNILSSTPSITAQTQIILSPDRDVSDGIVSLVKHSLYIEGQKPIKVVYSNRGDEIVLIVLSDSRDCKVVVGHTRVETLVACAKVMEFLLKQFPERARTSLSILPMNASMDDFSNKLGKEIVAAGFQFSGASRVGFVTEPANENR